MKKLGSTPLSLLLVLLSMVSISAGATLAKQLFPVFGSSGTTVLRLGIGAVLLALAWRPWRFRPSRREWKNILAYGVCLGLMNLMFYAAISRLPLGIAIAIEFLGPLSVSLYFSRRPLDFFWAFLAITGIALLLPASGLSGGMDLTGVCFALGAAVAWALYILLGKKAGAGTHAGMVTSFGMIFGFLAAAPFGVHELWAVPINGYLVLAAIGVGLLSSAIPYSAEMTAMRNLSSQSFGILMSLEPAVGAIAGYLFLGENLSSQQCVAILCVMTASIGSTAVKTPSPVAP